MLNFPDVTVSRKPVFAPVRISNLKGITGRRVKGYYSPKRNAIVVHYDPKHPVKFVHTLLHELTHWGLHQAGLDRFHTTLDYLDIKMWHDARYKLHIIVTRYFGDRVGTFVLCGHWIPDGKETP